jgi:nucleotide-binding universal stress UspA family protein
VSGTGRSVVVGVDGSTSALRAVRWAARAAASRGRDLLVVHAYGGVDPTLVIEAEMWRRYEHELVSRAHEVVAEAVAAAREVAPSVAVTEELVVGTAAPTLLARASGDGLLVVGEQGASGLEGALVGSVASAVAGHAPGPVVVVRGDEPVEADAPVVVGVDGSAAGAAAIDFAAATADAEGRPLVAVHTWWDPFLESVPEPFLPREAAVDDERRLLAEQLAGRSAEHPDLVVSMVVERAHPSRVLLERARGARLLVVGTRGRGGFAGLVLGSVSRAMVHRAPCPVAVVPTPSAHRPVEGARARAVAR